MFADDKYKAKSRADYVDNECYSDEYRETQPAKGIRHALKAIADATIEERSKLDDLMRDWLHAWALGEEDNSYAGAEELDPLLKLVHDILWEHGTHPYYDTEEELLETLKD